LSVALSPLRRLSAALDRLQRLSQLPEDGVWDAIWEKLRMELREGMEREASPTAAIIDSQSLKSAEKGAVMTA
jgi:hypothetical protein